MVCWASIALLMVFHVSLTNVPLSFMRLKKPPMPKNFWLFSSAVPLLR